LNWAVPGGAIPGVFAAACDVAEEKFPRLYIRRYPSLDRADTIATGPLPAGGRIDLRSGCRYSTFAGFVEGIFD